MFLMSLWRNVVRRDRVEADLDDEMRGVYAMLVDEKIRAGMKPADARRAAAIELGGIEQVKERVRDVRVGAFLESFLQDLRYGGRTFLRNPGFTTAAVLTLALGIGANTAIFSLLDAVMFKPLPVPAPGELFVVYQVAPAASADIVGGTGALMRFSYPAVQAFERRLGRSNSIAAMTRSTLVDVRLDTGAPLTRVATQLVSGEFFSTLGLRAERGRLLVDGDNQEANAAPVAVVSHAFWQQQLGSDTAVIGRQITVNGQTLTIVGVVTPPFAGIWVDTRVGIWIPLMMQQAIGYRQNYSSEDAVDDAPWAPQGRVSWLNVILRSSAAGPGAERPALDGVYRETSAEAAQGIHDPRARNERLARRLAIEPISHGFSGIRGQVSTALFVLMALVGAVLIIACANVTNLLLARSIARRGETSIRLSIGATRRRLIRQQLTESLLLATFGGALGFALGGVATTWLGRLALNLWSTPLPPAFVNDTRVLAFTAFVSLTVTLLVGLVPALRSTTSSTSGSRAIVDGTGSRGRGVHRLLVVQVALSLVLTIAAGLFARTLFAFATIDPGFDRTHLIAIDIGAMSGRRVESDVPTTADPANSATPYDRVRDRVRAMPGVTSVAISTCGLQNCSVESRVRLDSQQDDFYLRWNRVDTDYFRTVGMSLRQGRLLSEQDRSAGANVAVISEAMARRLFQGVNPLGHHISDRSGPIEIVGVVSDVLTNFREPAAPMAYYPFKDRPFGSVNVRVAGDPGGMQASIQKMLAQEEPDIPLRGVTTLQEQIRRNGNQEMLVASLASAFGLVALFLACLGLYGVMSYGVARRGPELGLRLALGAPPLDVGRLILSDGVRVLLFGLGIGLIGAFAGSRAVRALLFDVSATDFTTYAAAVSVLTVTMLVACAFPAIRAGRIDPAQVLRDV